MPDDALVAFLRARYDEREAKARAAGGASWSVGVEETSDGENAYYSLGAYGEEPFVDTAFAGTDVTELAKFEHIADNDPQFVLDDIAAKRQILDEIIPAVEALEDSYWNERRVAKSKSIEYDESRRLLRLLALPFAGHPDYREGWRPGAQTAQPDRPVQPPRRSVFDTSEVEAYWHSRNNPEG